MKLQKFMAYAGAGSRRACERMIRQGRVTVNGRIIRKPGPSVNPSEDAVKLDGKILILKKPSVYLLLNKPRGYISSRKDEKGRKTVFELLPPKYGRLFTVGRLDFNTEGLIILTDDGEWAEKIIHPRSQLPRTYMVKIRGKISPDQIRRLENGVLLNDKKRISAAVNFRKFTGKNAWIKMTIREGLNRQIHRMCKAVGKDVLKIKRIALGPVKLGKLPPAKYRFLRKDELETLEKSTVNTG